MYWKTKRYLSEGVFYIFFSTSERVLTVLIVQPFRFEAISNVWYR